MATERLIGIVPERVAPPGMRGNGIALDVALSLVKASDSGLWVDPSRLLAARSILENEAKDNRRDVNE